MVKLCAKLFLAAVLLGMGTPAFPHDENTSLTLEEATLQFQQDRFGLMIHWGLFSVLGDGEQVMEERQIPAADYERLARAFNPADFSAKEWVALAKSAGMRYITFTARSADGFAMWDSGVSDYNVARRTPFGRDVVRELTDECHQQNMRLYLDFSQLDWHHPDYFPRGLTGKSAGRPAQGDWDSYLAHRDAQLAELLMKYDPIAGIRLDGSSDRPEADWQLERVRAIVRAIRPAALLSGDGQGRPLPGGNSRTDDNATSGAAGLPREIPATLNRSRGYRITDRDYRSPRDLVSALVRAAGSDANLLLSVGAMPNGQIQPEFVLRLREIGMWLARHGETIYGTRGGPVPPQPWGATTSRDQTVYVHVLDSEITSVSLELPGRKVRTAQTFGSEQDIRFTDAPGMVSLDLPAVETGQMHRIVVLRTEETTFPQVESGLDITYNIVGE